MSGKGAASTRCLAYLRLGNGYTIKKSWQHLHLCLTGVACQNPRRQWLMFSAHSSSPMCQCVWHKNMFWGCSWTCFFPAILGHKTFRTYLKLTCGFSLHL
jgi:hypothetical protein